jgi:hypothetical protein
MDIVKSSYVPRFDIWQLLQSPAERIFDFVRREMQNSRAELGTQANKSPQHETITIVRGQEKQTPKFGRQY